MKLYTYENCDGDKGIIIADSWEKAFEIYKKEYPKRISEENTIIDYWERDGKGNGIGAIMDEFGDIENGKLYCTFPW